MSDLLARIVSLESTGTERTVTMSDLLARIVSLESTVAAQTADLTALRADVEADEAESVINLIPAGQ